MRRTIIATTILLISSLIGIGSAQSQEFEAESHVFDSLAACRAAVEGGAIARRAEGEIRLVAWNIRWFPVGDPRNEGRDTNLDWLACALTWLNADVIALQEIQSTEQADTAWAVVFAEMARLGNDGDWAVHLQTCGGAEAQHVGFLIDEARIEADPIGDLWWFNGAASSGSGSDCDGNLRPGFGVSVASPGGLDFTAVSVHLDSGRTSRDFNNRARVYDRFDAAHEFIGSDDDDVIVLGDFNTMGMSGVTGEEEIAAFTAKLSTEGPGYDVLVAPVGCSEYFEGRCGLLDHVAIASVMEEAENTSVHVSGVCALLGGEPFDEDDPPAAYVQLSDHCPLIVDIPDRDQD